jgi:Skp family chaperone for outer membrane proteins
VKTLLIRNWTYPRRLVVAALAAAIAISVMAPLRAQAPNPAGANAAKYNVAVVDISYIFKRHERFKATMESMKTEMQGIETELKSDREKIAALEQERNQFGAGTPDYKKRDEEVARQMAEFQLKMGRLRKDFLEREAKVYYQTYLEVVDAVRYYAKRQNIGLVLRFNGDPIDPNRREDVLREINKPVVVQDQIDITGDILVLLNRDNQNVTPSTPGTPPVTGQSGTQSGTNANRPGGSGSLLPPR